MQWFTADLHLGHAVVIGMCDCPFADLAVMEAHLLRAIQDRVGRDDDLWILVDFALAKDICGARDRIRNLFAAIPGRKHLIIGNHDRRWVRGLPWTSVAHFHELIVDRRRISLSHYPMVTFPGSGHGALQLFGHVHQNWAGSRNSINIGVDQWHYRPVALPEIEARCTTAGQLPLGRGRTRIPVPDRALRGQQPGSRSRADVWLCGGARQADCRTGAPGKPSLASARPCPAGCARDTTSASSVSAAIFLSAR